MVHNKIVIEERVIPTREPDVNLFSCLKWYKLLVEHSVFQYVENKEKGLTKESGYYILYRIK